MHIQNTSKFICAALLGLLLTACGGGSSSPLDNINNSSSSGGNTSTSSATSSVDTVNISKLGTGTGDNFQNGVIGVSNGENTLASGGSTTLTISIVSDTNSPVSTSTSVSFISNCIQAGKAKLTSAKGDEVTSVTTFNGGASIIYTDNGCGGQTDTIIATTTIDSKTLTAQVDIDIAAATIGSIQFVDATPTQISLKGSGGQESSTVRFKVVDTNGAPVEKATVNFTTSTTSGGITLTPATKASDRDGYVTTVINSGNIATSVSVIATVAESNIYTSSSNLVVSTGIPTQKSISLSADIFNPRAYDRDNEEVKITMSMADDFGNPVADNTSVSFWSEGGRITPSCTTKNGTCTVSWFSQDFRPSNMRVTVLAFATGNESFTDTNYNGKYDEGEPSFDDLSEAFLDENEDGIWQDSERVVDIIQPGATERNGTFDDADGIYNGTLCNSDSSSVCTKTKVTVRDSLVLSMSGPSAIIGSYSDESCETPSTVASPKNGAYVIYIKISDQSGNSMPKGTKIKIAGDTSGFTVSNTPNALCYQISLTADTAIPVSTETPEKEVSSAVLNITIN